MTPQNPPPSNERIVNQYNKYLIPIWKNLNVPIKRASGCTLEDFNGNEYLDVFSGISVTNVGHNNETVIKAAKDQLDELVHGCTYVHPNQPAAKLAERLESISPGNLQKTFFCNSGTEAVEGAIKLARKYTGSKEVLALEMSFHGRTLGSLALTGNKSYKSDMAPTINDVAHVAPPYAYRCRLCSGDTCSCACTRDLTRVIDTHTSGDLAAVIVEPVMGEGGIIVPPQSWLSHVKNITHEHDALFIVDEVQTGYGRTGELFASNHFDVVPDIMTQAKGIANGLPLGAFTASAEIADAFESGDHLSTFGGNPIACAAALATIDELQDGIIDNVREQGEWLAEQLESLEREYDVIGETRGIGLMQGVEFVDPNSTESVQNTPDPDSTFTKHLGQHLRQQGIVVGIGGFYNNVVRFQPPLTISRSQLKRAVNGLRKAVETELNT